MSETDSSDVVAPTEPPESVDPAPASPAPPAANPPPAPPAANPPPAPPAADPPPAPRRRHRLRTAVIASAIVLVVLLGAGAAGAGLYYRSVALPEPLRFPSNTTLYYRDGSVLAQLGQYRRTALPYSEMIEVVSRVAVAAEDPDFWTNLGGPIARSVARTSYDLVGTSRSARLRVAVSAWKMEDKLAKEQVLEAFLNNSSFGRDTYGVEAAAREYFGKTADKRAKDVPPLTMAEAVVLVAMVRQPEPDPANPKASPGYDPKMSPEAEANSRHRFDEIVASMRDLRYLTPEQASALAYPTNAKPHDGRARLAALSKPVGLVVNQVLSELTQGSQSPFRGMKWSAIVDGGYGIYTTIDPRAQSALEHAADGEVSGSAMYGQPAELQAAAVLVEPGTGRVLGYYGGDEGTGRDYAGIYADERGDWTGFGAHPPGDTFMVHTLAAALKVGYSLNSYWSWPPHDMPGRQGTAQLRNTSACPLGKDRSGACSLLDSTTASLNVPYYTVTVSVTPAKVLEMARDAGVNYMWSDSRERVDLTKQTAMTAVTPSKFDTTVGIGQYPVTVIDQANAMATYGAGGLRASAHFVYHVMDGDHIVYGETLPAPDQPRVLNSAAIADLDYALSQSPAGKLTGRVSASKTGSWEYNNSDNQTAHAWMVGYTSKLAMAVWIGNRSVEQPLRDARQSTIWGSGLPSTIYRDVMNSVHDSMSTPDADFPVPAIGGNVNPPGSVPR